MRYIALIASFYAFAAIALAFLFLSDSWKSLFPPAPAVKSAEHRGSAQTSLTTTHTPQHNDPKVLCLSCHDNPFMAQITPDDDYRDAHEAQGILCSDCHVDAHLRTQRKPLSCSECHDKRQSEITLASPPQSANFLEVLHSQHSDIAACNTCHSGTIIDSVEQRGIRLGVHQETPLFRLFQDASPTAGFMQHIFTTNLVRPCAISSTIARCTVCHGEQPVFASRESRPAKIVSFFKRLHLDPKALKALQASSFVSIPPTEEIFAAELAAWARLRKAENGYLHFERLYAPLLQEAGGTFLRD